MTPTLLLIHGLGATPGVWHDVERALDWPGRVTRVKLAGHGSARWSGDYTIGALGAGVSAQCEPDESVIVLGHSLGGAVGLCLASNLFRPNVLAAIGIGIKVNWSDEDVAGVAKVAAKGIRWFDSKEEAEQRYLAQSGLRGLIEPDHPALADAVASEDGRWRVTQDPATFAQRALDTRGLLDGARCPVVLGAGEQDAMVSAHELQAFVHEPRIAPGCGHNVQIEDPAWVCSLLADVAGSS